MKQKDLMEVNFIAGSLGKAWGEHPCIRVAAWGWSHLKEPMPQQGIIRPVWDRTV